MSSEVVASSGQMNSFHWLMKANSATTAIAGQDSGTMIVHRIIQVPAPSMRAASSRLAGMVIMCWRRKKTEKPEAKKGRISAIRVSSSSSRAKVR